MRGDVDLSQLAIKRDDTERDDEENSSRERGRSRILTRYVLPSGLLLGFVTLVLWSAWDFIRPPLDVEVIPVRPIQSAMRQAGTPLFNAAGWIEPRPTRINVAALAPGVVEDLLVVEDQAVKAGEPIAELVKDDARLLLERAEAEFELRTAEVALAQARLTAANTRFNDPSHLEAPIAAAAAVLAKIETELANLPFQEQRAEAQLVYHRINYESKKQAKDVIAARDLDQARSELDSSVALVAELLGRETTLLKEEVALKARLAALEELLELKPNEKQAVDEAAAQLQASHARTRQAGVLVDEAKLRLSRMTIRAPVDGRVLALVATPGARVASGAAKRSHNDDTTVVTMYQPNSLQVRVDVRFSDLPQVQVAQPVEIKSPAVSNPLFGRVLFVSSRADIQKNTLEVKVLIENPPEVFKPEMLVDVTFLAAPPKASAEGGDASNERTRITVPKRLVRDEDGKRVIWIADQSKQVANKAIVETAPSSGDWVEVTSGLTITSRLIANNLDALREGTRIRVVEEKTALPEPNSSNVTPSSSQAASERNK